MQFKLLAMEQEIQKALEILKNGGIILYPTDTVWGIGCDATNAQAIERIFALKRRPDTMAMAVLADRPDTVMRCVREVPEVAWQLWEVSDKPLTIILPGAESLAPNLIPPQKTIAIRLATDDFCRQLIYKLARPIVSTSANISGEKTPATFAEISQEIKNGVDLVVEPSMQSPQATGKASSIISLGLSGQVTIVRA